MELIKDLKKDKERLNNKIYEKEQLIKRLERECYDYRYDVDRWYAKISEIDSKIESLKIKQDSLISNEEEEKIKEES